MFDDPWPQDVSWVKTTALLALPVLLVGAVGYRYLTTATPVTVDEAVRLFRADRTTEARAPRASAGMRRSRGDDGAGANASRRRPANTQPSNEPERRVVVASSPRSSGGARRSEVESSEPRRRATFSPGAPEEGVYSWTTEGYESFNGSRREFPRETQRIVTRHGPTSWTLHHYFSKERESWTDVRTDTDGYRTTRQRNRVVFGPVARDVTITFDPPMFTGPMPPRVGARWSGEWEGKTYGTYQAHYFEKGTITIGEQDVDVWGIEYLIRLRGETEGTTWAQVWISPDTHMVVREHYKQDVQTGPGEYRAEWEMTVKSLRPRS